MKDVQKEKPKNPYLINKVGIKEIIYPIKIKVKDSEKYHSISAVISMFVSLGADERGTHMSRFLEVLNSFRDKLDLDNVKELLIDIIYKLEVPKSFIEMTFPYFIKKTAPISKKQGYMEYNCKYTGEASFSFLEGYTVESYLEVSVPISSVCPCSKEISDRGAHNQRVILNIGVPSHMDNKTIWLEDIIQIAESSGSCELFPILKREDEKFVTETGYDNPKFVEDIVREATFKLKNIGIINFKVEAISLESIHNHSAYALIET